MTSQALGDVHRHGCSGYQSVSQTSVAHIQLTIKARRCAAKLELLVTLLGRQMLPEMKTLFPETFAEEVVFFS